MPVNYDSAPGGITLETGFLKETEILERYIGNKLWAWGRNGFGQLGKNDRTHRSSPVQEILGGTSWKFIAFGGGLTHSAAIKTDGTLWAWGLNTNGQLGKNDITHRSSPVQEVFGNTTWKLVSTGGYHTAAIKTDGTLWTWGKNNYGQLGKNDITHRSSPVQELTSNTSWKLVASGAYHTAAIKTDGTLWSWGFGTNGELGDNSSITKSSPVQEALANTMWKHIACGANHTAVIKTDNTLWLWGFNTQGQLGKNDITHRSSPVQEVTESSNWKQVAGGEFFTAAIKNDGTLWSWGHNGWGQLGNNTDITHRSSPIQTVSGGTNWKQVACGATYSAAIKTDGTLWLWGQNTNGALGDNTIVHRSSPVQTVFGGTNWKQVACGLYHTLAVTFKES
jgi:alpha-tubulin suppressor-like RCC1 family protein